MKPVKKPREKKVAPPSSRNKFREDNEKNEESEVKVERKKKVMTPEKVLENTRKKMDKLKIKKQLELEKINLKRQQDFEKFQAKKDIVYKKKIDNVNSKIDLSAKNLKDLLESLK